MSTSEASTLQPNTPVPTVQTHAAISVSPLLGEGFRESGRKLLLQSTDNSDLQHSPVDRVTNKNTKSEKTPRLFDFGEQRSEDSGDIMEQNAASTMTTSIAQPTARRAVPIPSSSPPRPNPDYIYQSSPPQRILYSSSPRIISPAGSQIFERDVQESSLPGLQTSPAIPSHIQTENHIPAVLDASSEAITNDSLDPDSVEIIMHSAHQPAAVTVTGVMEQSWSSTWADDLIFHPGDDSASNYGALDSADVRRLSFISFSDIVQSEHAEHVGSRDSIYVAGLSSLSSGHNRSPSPVRSPVSSQGFGTSPPTSKSASIKGVEMSPRGKPLGSPISTHLSFAGGELTIETMSQALRRTGSGDLSGYRSQPLSPSSPDGPSELR